MNNNINLTQQYNSDLMCVGLDAPLTEEGVRNLLMKIEKQNIINTHKFSEKPDKNGYFRVYIKDPTRPKGYRQLRDRNIDNLKERVYNFVKEIPDSKKTITFSASFEYALRFEMENVSPERQYSKNNTISKHRSEYRRFFQGTGFEIKPINEITMRDIDMEVRTILKRHKLTKKGMESIRGIINLTFKRALYMGWIDVNPADRVIWKDYSKLLVEPIPVSNRAYTIEELGKINGYVLAKQRKQRSYIPAYALEFQMLTGMRRGEIAPLLWSDIDWKKMAIHVHRELISQSNKRHSTEHICDYTKNGKERFYPIARREMEFLTKLKQVHDAYYPDSQFLFPANTLNGCITNNAVYQFFRRICEKLDIPITRECIRGTHAFRRNAITEVVNNSNGNCVLAAQMFGNSPETIRKHYYVGNDLEEMRNVLEMRDSKRFDETDAAEWSYSLPFWSYKTEKEKTPRTL